MFGKTNVTGQIFKFISHRCRLSFHLESLFAGYTMHSVTTHHNVFKTFVNVYRSVTDVWGVRECV
jgi:hypothetical protein